MNNNPLKQYFRRPAVYLRLPSNGSYYTPDQLEFTETGELPVYPMTAIDDITIKTPDALFNGSAVVEIIKSCVPNIKKPWEIAASDLDAVLISIRAASGNSELEIDSPCPNCKTDNTYQINLIGILGTLKCADYEKMFQIGDLEIKFIPLRYKDINETSLAQFEVQKMLSMLADSKESADTIAKKTQEAILAITSITTKLMARAIKFIKTPNAIVDNQEHIVEFLQNCDKTTFDSLRDHFASLRKESEIKAQQFKCTNCGHEYKQEISLNPTTFFA